jgi:hypothetical protein
VISASPETVIVRAGIVASAALAGEDEGVVVSATAPATNAAAVAAPTAIRIIRVIDRTPIIRRKSITSIGAFVRRCLPQSRRALSGFCQFQASGR